MRIFLHSIYAFYFVLFCLVFYLWLFQSLVLFRTESCIHLLCNRTMWWFSFFFHYYVYSFVIMLNIEPYAQPNDYVGFHCIFHSYGHTWYIIHVCVTAYLFINMVDETRNRNRISIQADCSYPDSGLIWSSIPRKTIFWKK